MIRAGEILENPVNHIQMVFITTSENSQEDLLVYDVLMPPALEVPYGDHMHLAQEQRAQIISGIACYRLRGVEYKAARGDKIVFPRGISHVDPWNAGEAELRYRLLFEPGRTAEAAFETALHLLRDGKFRKDGSFNLLENALILQESGFETYFVGAPIGLQRVLIPCFALIARLLGYHANPTVIL